MGKMNDILCKTLWGKIKRYSNISLTRCTFQKERRSPQDWLVVQLALEPKPAACLPWLFRKPSRRLHGSPIITRLFWKFGKSCWTSTVIFLDSGVWTRFPEICNHEFPQYFEDYEEHVLRWEGNRKMRSLSNAFLLSQLDGHPVLLLAIPGFRTVEFAAHRSFPRNPRPCILSSSIAT